MREIDFAVPPMGESFDSARLVRWLVAPGERFNAGDILAEIETDKSIVEVPAPHGGVIVDQLVKLDQRLNQDTPIARIRPETIDWEGSISATAANAVAATSVRNTSTASVSVKAALPLSAGGLPPLAGSTRRLATPAARRLARELDLDLATISGTGPNGRITRIDITHGIRGDSSRGFNGNRSFVSTSHGDVCVTTWEPVQGSAEKTVFMLHGLFADGDIWSAVANVLVHANVRVIAVDLPFHGDTAATVDDVRQLVDCVAQVLMSHRTGQFALIGHSLGGAIAARVARDQRFVSSLVLVAPVGIGTRIDQCFLDGMTNADTEEALSRELRKLTVSGTTPSRGFITKLRTTIVERRANLIQLCRLVARNGVQQIDITPDLTASTAPTTLILGQRDGITPCENVPQIPSRVSMHIVSDAGHMPHAETPNLVAAILLDRMR